MKTNDTSSIASDLMASDFKEIGEAAMKLAVHAIKFGGLGFGTSFLNFFASFAAIYLLVLNRTNCTTKMMLTALLIPYLFFSIPSSLFGIFRGEFGKWIVFPALVSRLFFPDRFPDWLETPGVLILLIRVSPSFLANTLRVNIFGVAVCLLIACYLLQEHIRASGGFQNMFTESHGIFNSIGIILLMVYPVWVLFSVCTRYTIQPRVVLCVILLIVCACVCACMIPFPSTVPRVLFLYRKTLFERIEVQDDSYSRA